MVKNIPDEKGYYWARSDKGFQWYDMIVRVYGDAPFFRIKAWLLSGVNERCGEVHLHDIEDFGPKIIECEVPAESIKR